MPQTDTDDPLTRDVKPPSKTTRIYKPMSTSVFKTAGIGLLVLVIFSAGVMVGNGSLMFNNLQSLNGNLPAKLNYSTVNQVYDTLKQNYDGKLTQEQLTDGLKTGLAKSTGDPYTEYFPPKAAKEFREQLSGMFSGIGAELGKDLSLIHI